MTDFIPLGQRGVVCVINANNLIYFSHYENIGNSNTQNLEQVHQGQLLGYFVDEQLGQIFSIGSNESVIRKFIVQNN